MKQKIKKRKRYWIKERNVKCIRLRLNKPILYVFQPVKPEKNMCYV